MTINEKGGGRDIRDVNTGLEGHLVAGDCDETIGVGDYGVKYAGLPGPGGKSAALDCSSLFVAYMNVGGLARLVYD